MYIDIKFVLAACNNLLTVDEELNQCRFSHLSVQEYLETHQWSNVQAHGLIAATCLKSLNCQTFQQYSLPELRQRIEDDDLVLLIMYAIHYWIDYVKEHEKDEKGEVYLQVACQLQRFLGSPEEISKAYRLWYHILEELEYLKGSAFRFMIRFWEEFLVVCLEPSTSGLLPMIVLGFCESTLP